MERAKRGKELALTCPDAPFIRRLPWMLPETAKASAQMGALESGQIEPVWRFGALVAMAAARKGHRRVENRQLTAPMHQVSAGYR